MFIGSQRQFTQIFFLLLYKVHKICMLSVFYKISLEELSGQKNELSAQSLKYIPRADSRLAPSQWENVFL